MIKMKKFNDHDWECYAGAEGNAMISKGEVKVEGVTIDGVAFKEARIIVDDNGVFIEMFDEDTGSTCTYSLDVYRRVFAELVIEKFGDKITKKIIDFFGFALLDFSIK